MQTLKIPSEGVDDAFAAFAGVPLPENQSEALLALRRAARDEIDRLLAFLDATESDSDFEPSLGAPGAANFPPQTHWADGITDDDREATTGPRDEELDEGDLGELDGDYMDCWFNPPHLRGGGGAEAELVFEDA